MKDIIKEIQDEINSLMVSKIAKSSDKRLESFDKLSKLKVGGKNAKKAMSKKVEQYSLTGELICVYDSLIQASNAVGRNKSRISQAALGKYKTCGGFIWKYKN